MDVREIGWQQEREREQGESNVYTWYIFTSRRVGTLVLCLYYRKVREKSKKRKENN